MGHIKTPLKFIFGLNSRFYWDCWKNFTNQGTEQCAHVRQKDKTRIGKNCTMHNSTQHNKPRFCRLSARKQAYSTAPSPYGDRDIKPKEATS